MRQHRVALSCSWCQTLQELHNGSNMLVLLLCLCILSFNLIFIFVGESPSVSFVQTPTHCTHHLLRSTTVVFRDTDRSVQAVPRDLCKPSPCPAIASGSSTSVYTLCYSPKLPKYTLALINVLNSNIS